MITQEQYELSWQSWRFWKQKHDEAESDFNRAKLISDEVAATLAFDQATMAHSKAKIEYSRIMSFLKSK